MVSLGQVLVGMGKLSLPCPVPIDWLVGVDHPVHRRESQHRPRKGLPYRGRVVSVEPVSPRVDEVPPASQYGTVFVPRMVLSSEGRAPNVAVLPIHCSNPFWVETRFFGRDLLPSRHPDRSPSRVRLCSRSTPCFVYGVSRRSASADWFLHASHLCPSWMRAARGTPARFEWSCTPVVRTAEWLPRSLR